MLMSENSEAEAREQARWVEDQAQADGILEKWVNSPQ